MISVLSILSLAATTVFAAPTTLPARQTTVGTQCAGLGPGAFDDASDFTLAAWATNGPNANTTGIPLVLGQAGVITGAELKVLSTWASYPYNDFPLLSLQNGGLTATDSFGNIAEAGLGIPGEALSFITPEQAAPYQVYCAVTNDDPAQGGYPLLAVNGDTDSFSLCPSGTYAGEQVNVIYQATADKYGTYLYDECVSIKLHIVGL